MFHIILYGRGERMGTAIIALSSSTVIDVPLAEEVVSLSTKTADLFKVYPINVCIIVMLLSAGLALLHKAKRTAVRA